MQLQFVICLNPYFHGIASIYGLAQSSYYYLQYDLYLNILLVNEFQFFFFQSRTMVVNDATLIRLYSKV